jgi:tetratricopeptide (TPR) repeat protein
MLNKGLASDLEERDDLRAAAELLKEGLSHHEAMGVRDKSAASLLLQYGALLARLERADEARAHLEEALAMATESGSPSARVLSLVHLALLDGGHPAKAIEALREDTKRLEHGSCMEARFLLYKATGDKQHLEAAHDLLTFFVEHAPEQYRETTLTNVKLHRGIMAAWNSLDPERTK